MGVLQGKVVLVTGAGRGVGREIALLAARQGAKVVVNDLGGTMDGRNEGLPDPAEEVVEEIRATGGEAIADTNSVSDRAGADAMVAKALEAFGGLHAVANPAGILRDRMFHNMGDDDWRSVIDVHLTGSYNVARAAIEHFRKQEDGVLVFFTSSAGLVGNIGQANYSAAKLGIVGLSRSIALEGARKNIRSNVVAPFAWTRMLASIPVKSEEQGLRLARLREAMRSDQVAHPVVALMADGAKDVTGQILALRGNEIILMSQPRPSRSVVRMEGWSPETVLSHGFPALSGHLVPLEGTNEVFNWEVV
ncbi:MAG: SDR family NAD(P)-dependent oxidoreductase [Gammaproteobacteria bacterium]|nr:SDR family NAD(P)-dependent oxidoreductase [Gammaproteobacteria bacterium]